MRKSIARHIRVNSPRHIRGTFPLERFFCFILSGELDSLDPSQKPRYLRAFMSSHQNDGTATSHKHTFSAHLLRNHNRHNGFKSVSHPLSWNGRCSYHDVTCNCYFSSNRNYQVNVNLVSLDFQNCQSLDIKSKEVKKQLNLHWRKRSELWSLSPCHQQVALVDLLQSFWINARNFRTCRMDGICATSYKSIRSCRLPKI